MDKIVVILVLINIIVYIVLTINIKKSEKQLKEKLTNYEKIDKEVEEILRSDIDKDLKKLHDKYKEQSTKTQLSQYKKSGTWKLEPSSLALFFTNGDEMVVVTRGSHNRYFLERKKGLHNKDLINFETANELVDYFVKIGIFERKEDNENC